MLFVLLCMSRSVIINSYCFITMKKDINNLSVIDENMTCSCHLLVEGLSLQTPNILYPSNSQYSLYIINFDILLQFMHLELDVLL